MKFLSTLAIKAEGAVKDAAKAGRKAATKMIFIVCIQWAYYLYITLALFDVPDNATIGNLRLS